MNLFGKKNLEINFIHLLTLTTTFSYAVLYSSLTIYLLDYLHFPIHTSNGIVGFFIAANFILHLFGGQLSNRLLDHRSILVVSLALQLLGSYLIYANQNVWFYIGLSFSLIGFGFAPTSLKCILARKFLEDDSKRDKAFYANYSFMNLGFLLGFTVAGYYENHHDYIRLFYYINIVNLFSVILLIFSLRWIDQKNNNSISKIKKISGYITILFFITLILIGLNYVYAANNLILIFGLISLFIIFLFAKTRGNQKIKNGMYVFAILSVFSIVFWTLYYIGPIGFIYFLKNNVDTRILNYQVPPQWFMNLNSLIIIIGAPLIAHWIIYLKSKNFSISLSFQFLLALILISLSFLILSIGILYSDFQGQISIIWIFVHYFLQSLGEILIAPIAYSMVGKLIPENLQSVIMGFGMMISGIASSLAHHISNEMMQLGHTNSSITNLEYFNIFNQLSIYSGVAIFIFFMIYKWLDRLTKI